MRISDWSSDVCSSDLAVAPDMRDAKAGAGADDGDRPGLGKWLVGAGQPLEIARVRLRDRMAHRLEILDQYVAVDAELLVYQRGANDPRIVGAADDVAARRSSDGNGHCARQHNGRASCRGRV